MAFLDDFWKFQIVSSIFHFYKAVKMKKSAKKDLLIILPVKNTVFHKFAVQLSSFYGVEFFSFFSRFSWGIPFFFSFLTRNSKPRKMRHVDIIVLWPFYWLFWAFFIVPWLTWTIIESPGLYLTPLFSKISRQIMCWINFEFFYLSDPHCKLQGIHRHPW